MPWEGFQSPSGVLGVCRAIPKSYVAWLQLHVSVPFRGFRGLQAVGRLRMRSQQLEVSVPFRGFRGLQGLDLVLLDEKVAVFQSPSGVLGVCRNEAHNGLSVEQAEAFQSPSGVLGVCRLLFAAAEQSSVLTQFQSPSGVLGVCRTKESDGMGGLGSVFQSPSGVLGVCR